MRVSTRSGDRRLCIPRPHARVHWRERAGAPAGSETAERPSAHRLQANPALPRIAREQPCEPRLGRATSTGCRKCTRSSSPAISFGPSVGDVPSGSSRDGSDSREIRWRTGRPAVASPPSTSSFAPAPSPTSTFPARCGPSTPRPPTRSRWTSPVRWAPGSTRSAARRPTSRSPVASRPRARASRAGSAGRSRCASLSSSRSCTPSRVVSPSSSSISSPLNHPALAPSAPSAPRAPAPAPRQ